jgi:hypothetical protein
VRPAASRPLVPPMANQVVPQQGSPMALSRPLVVHRTDSRVVRPLGSLMVREGRVRVMREEE